MSRARIIPAQYVLDVKRCLSKLNTLFSVSFIKFFLIYVIIVKGLYLIVVSFDNALMDLEITRRTSSAKLVRDSGCIYFSKIDVVVITRKMATIAAITCKAIIC